MKQWQRSPSPFILPSECFEIPNYCSALITLQRIIMPATRKTTALYYALQRVRLRNFSPKNATPSSSCPLSLQRVHLCPFVQRRNTAPHELTKLLVRRWSQRASNSHHSRSTSKKQRFFSVHAAVPTANSGLGEARSTGLGCPQANQSFWAPRRTLLLPQAQKVPSLKFDAPLEAYLRLPGCA